MFRLECYSDHIFWVFAFFQIATADVIYTLTSHGWIKTHPYTSSCSLRWFESRLTLPSAPVSKKGNIVIYKVQNC